MNDRIRRLYEMFLRVSVFMTANAADFQNIPFVASTVTALKTATDRLAALGAEKTATTAAAKDSFIFKGDARDSLRDYLEYIAEVWRTIYDEAGAAENKFRVPPGNNDQNLIAAGKSFAAGLPEYEQIFLDHGLEPTFIEILTEKTETFEQTLIAAETTHGERVGTNAAFDEPARQAKRLVDKLAPVVKRTYRNNPKKLAEWLVASHIERPSKSKGRDIPEA